MNFLAHYVLATRYREPPDSLPDYVLGNALPDLLPLAAPRARLRRAVAECAPVTGPGQAALRSGVLTHLVTDAIFHKTDAFARAQADMKALLRDGGFVGMRLRPFFLAHVLAELALDAALLRAEPGLAADFYTKLDAADFAQASRWTEATLHTGLPELPAVLTRFTRSRYLHSYADDEGVAEGLSRLCDRARQDTFEGPNFARLSAAVAAAVRRMDSHAPGLLAETAAALPTERVEAATAGRNGMTLGPER